MAKYAPILIIVLLHMGLAAWYASITPYRAAGYVNGQVVQDYGAPDERQHANYVQTLLDGKGFPVLRPGSTDLYETYQSHQPPAFYLLAAGYAKLTGISDVTDKGQGLRLRFLNVIIGGSCIAGIFFLALWGLGREDVALAAAVFAALLPMNLALSGAVSNDPLLFSLCTWALAITALALNNGWTLRLGVVLGIVMGLAFLTKTTAIGIVPPILVGIYLGRKTSAPGKAVAIAAAIAFLLAVPWWVRNMSLYQDPFAMKAFNAAFTGNPTPETLPKMVGHPISMPDYLIQWVGWWTGRSFIGVFGYMDIFLFGPDFYRVVLFILGCLAIAGILELRKDKSSENRLPIHVMNGLFIVVVGLLFLSFNMKYFQGQARYLFPAIAPISIGIALGLAYYSKQKMAAATLFLGALLFMLNIYILQILPIVFEKRSAVPVATSILRGRAQTDPVST